MLPYKHPLLQPLAVATMLDVAKAVAVQVLVRVLAVAVNEALNNGVNMFAQLRVFVFVCVCLLT